MAAASKSSAGLWIRRLTSAHAAEYSCPQTDRSASLSMPLGESIPAARHVCRYAGLCQSERRAWRDPYTLILTPFALPMRAAPPAPACGTRSLTLWQPSGMLVLLPAPWHATLEVAPCPGADVACGGPAHAPRHAVPVQASEITRDTTAEHTARVHILYRRLAGA